MKFHSIWLFIIILFLIYPTHAASHQDEPGEMQASVSGQNGSQNHAEFLDRVRKEAEQGAAAAQSLLANMYLQGKGVPRDYAEAAKWMLKIAERGALSVQFQLELGLMYLQGNGVPQDYAEALRWIRAAAGNGHVTAQANLGLMYLQGNGVPHDYAEAEKWIRKAAGQANTSAQCMLGAMYAEGTGVTQDYMEAYKWLTLSVDLATDKQSQVFKKATDLRESIARKMTPQQTAEARRLAREWTDRWAQRMDNGVYSVGNEVKPPEVLYKPLPSYTLLARQARIEGSILLKCIVRKDGTVDSFKIIRGLGWGLDESAIKTIATRWRFKPGTRNGIPVDVWANIEVTFRL